MKLRKIVPLAVVVMVCSSPDAWAHSRLEKALPKPGTRLEVPPDHMILRFDSPLDPRSVVHVYDGCRRSVIDNFAVQGRMLHVFLQQGEPGRYLIHYVAVSKKDGHPQPGKFSLKVAGRTACDAEEPGAQAAPASEDQPGVGGGVLVGIGIVLVAGLALAVRIASSR